MKTSFTIRNNDNIQNYNNKLNNKYIRGDDNT